MAYGSSPLFGLNYTGKTGPTGISGPVGVRGSIGPTGNMKFGATGPSITGITLNSNGIITTIFDDGQRFDTITKLIGATGNYYIPADADVLSNTLSFIKGVCYYYNDGDSVQNVIHLRGLTTAAPDVLKINIDQNNNINVQYSIFNTAYIGISGGSVGQIIYNKPGDHQYGLTGTGYTTSNNSATAQIANYSERISILNPIFEPTYAGGGFYYWKIDSDVANIFKLIPWTNDPIASGVSVDAQMLYIKSPTNESVSKGMTIIIPNGITSSNKVTTLYATTEDLSIIPDIEDFEENISWPLTIPPCFTQNVDILNLISVGDVWYANFSHLGFTFGVAGDIVGDIDKVPTLLPLTEEMFDCARGNNILGLCCPSNNTNPFETIEVLCDGLFFPGLTLTDPCYVCDDVGVCCITNPDGSITKIQEFISESECFNFANGLEYTWTIKDNSIITVDQVNCSNAKQLIGACCDGNGGCTEIAQSDCLSQNGTYQGDGVLCQSGAGNRCAIGTGACCLPTGGCTDNLTPLQCTAQNGTYRGDGTSCSTIFCSTQTNDCYFPILNNVELIPGTEFEGGIVVGVFNPNRTTCLGNTAFAGLPAGLQSATEIEKFNFLTNGDLRQAQPYFSKYNPLGYGFTLGRNDTCDEDSWLLLVSKYPVIISENPNQGQFIRKDFNITFPYVSKFTWSHGGTYFGWIMNDAGQIPSTLIAGEQSVNDDLTKDEGFYTFKVGSNGITYFGNEYSFTNCLSPNNQPNLPVNRSGTGLNYGRMTFNGKWHPNYGLYNTIRMTCAERHAYNLDSGYDLPSVTSSCNCNYTKLFGFGTNLGFTTNYGNWSISTQSSAEAISAVNFDYFTSRPDVVPSLSDWYLPSIDELSFIANSIANNDLNGRILQLLGIPIGDTRIGANGWVWSSTGTFNEGKTAEYQQTVSVNTPSNPNTTTHNPVAHGTEAWAMQINLSNLAEPNVAKANRMTKYEVRPVRLIRCDRRYYTASDEIRYWRFWKIPILPAVKIIGTYVPIPGKPGPIINSGTA